MGLESFLQWWARALVRPIPMPLRRLFSPQTPVLRVTLRGTLMLERRHGRRARALGPLEALAPADRARLETKVRRRRLSVSLALPETMIGTQRIQLPAGAAGELEHVLGFEIDRLTPFERHEIYFAGRVAATDRVRESIDVDIAFTPRDRVEPYISRLRDAGLAPSWMGLETTPDDRQPLNLLPVQTRRRGTMGQFLTFALSCAVLALAGTIWFEADARRNERVATLELELGDLRRDLLSRTAEDASAIELAARAAHDLKAAATPMVAVLAELTDLIPDGTALASLDVSDDLLQISGQSDDPTALIQLFEDSEGFADPSFVSSITRDGSDGKARFLLQVRIDSPATVASQP